MGGRHGKSLLESSLSVATWRHKTEAVLKLLEGINVLSSPHGESWVRGMKRYYGSRLGALIRMAPPGAERHAKAFEDRWLKL